MVDLDAVATVLRAELQPVEVPSPSSKTANPNAVMERLRSKRWRRSALSEKSRADLEAKIYSAEAAEQPLSFSIPFGGYKAWHEDSCPEPNWAEVFAVAHLRRMFAGVVELWPNGVVAEFTYASNVMDFVSNMPLDWQRSYVAQLQALLRHFSCDRIRFVVTDIAERDPIGFRNLVIADADRLIKCWESDTDEVAREAKLASARRNLVPVGVNDLSRLDDRSMKLEIRRAAIACDALDRQPLRRDYNKYSHRIQLVYVRGPEPSLHIGSCITSSNHFWATSGVLERRVSELLPRLLTKAARAKQWKESVVPSGTQSCRVDWSSLDQIAIVTPA